MYVDIFSKLNSCSNIYHIVTSLGVQSCLFYSCYVRGRNLFWGMDDWQKHAACNLWGTPRARVCVCVCVCTDLCTCIEVIRLGMALHLVFSLVEARF